MREAKANCTTVSPDGRGRGRVARHGLAAALALASLLIAAPSAFGAFQTIQGTPRVLQFGLRYSF